MATWIETRNQLGLIESSLKTLKYCKHVGDLEFRDMYSAMEKHHRNFKLAHLTGLAKDVMEQGRQDTRFYVILAKMLSEVSRVSYDNPDGVQKVYSWYQSNRHVLHTKPKFGKSKKDIHKRSTSSEPRAKSAKNKSNGHPPTRLPSPQEEIHDSDNTPEDLKAIRSQEEDESEMKQEEKVKDQEQYHRVENVMDETLLPKRKPLPLTHMFNPLSRALEEMEKHEKQPVAPVQVHVSPRGTIRSSDAKKVPLAKWEEYLKENSTGQEILSKLQYVGRSGIPGTVRYAAHENGLLAEDLTQDIINAYVQYNRPTNNEVDDSLIKQPLEDFYKSTEGHYPVNIGRRTPRIKSASSGRNSAASKESKRGTATSKQSSRPVSQAHTPEAPSVKLDTVVNMIDSVSDEMAYYKEKLIAEPASGFRQPILPLDPDLTLDAAPPGSLARPSSPSEHGYRKLSDVESVDWRGRVTPDPSKQRWQKSGFGSHSFVKKTPRPKTSHVSLRSAGSIQLNKRPTTAPVSAKQKWGTHNPSDYNRRAPCQAATHRTMEVDEKATNELVNIRHLDSSGAGRRPRSVVLGDLDMSFLGSDFSLEQELLMLRSELRPFTCPTSSNPIEFVNISAPKALQDSRAVSAGNKPRTRHGFNQADPKLALPASIHQFCREQDSCQQPRDPQEAATFMTDEDGVKRSHLTQQSTERFNARTSQAERDIEESKRILAELTHFMQDQQQDVSDVDPLTPPLPSVKVSDNADLDDLVEVTVQKLHPEEDSVKPFDKSDDSGHSQESFVPVPYSEDLSVLPDIQTVPKDIDVDQYLREIEKNSTQIPNQHVKLANAYRQRIFQRTFSKKRKDTAENQQEIQSLTVEGLGSCASRNKMRTAGTVPAQAKSSSYGNIFEKQDEMLKRNPVTALRTSPSIPTPSHYQVLGAKQPCRGKTFSPELDSHARRDRNPKHYMEKVGRLRAPNSLTPVPPTGTDDYLLGSLTVSRFADNRKPGSTDQVEPQSSGALPSGTKDDGRSIRIHITHKQTAGTTDISKTGRPIPHYGSVQTPEQYQEEIRKQQIAKAAVDIQRIFRGYVVRNQYDHLRREIRERREDERKAELEKQQKYMDHLERVNNIYNRGPDAESAEWTEQYDQRLSEEEAKRRYKAVDKENEHKMNKATADASLSVIGPHLEVYVPFHPKNVGPTKATLHKAACIVQKIVKGWLVRVRMDRLKRKSKWHASSWAKFTNQYQELLRRIQLRAGIQRPKTPFSYSEINEFMDVKKRYEMVFEKRAFGGELEVQELIEYFHECDLYPTAMELDGAFDSVFRGQAIKKGRGLYKHEVLELTFQLYPPIGTGIKRDKKSSWMNPIVDGEEAIKLLGRDEVEPTDFQTCWNLVAASRQGRKEQEQSKEEQERDRKLEDELLWQKSPEVPREKEKKDDTPNFENIGANIDATKCKKVKSKVRFDVNVEKIEETTQSDVNCNDVCEVSREGSLEGSLFATKKDNQTD